MSAGVFLVVSYKLAVEALEHSENYSMGFLWIAVGIIFVWIVFKLIPDFHNHEISDPTEIHENILKHKLDPRRILISDSFHNIADGIFIAAAFSINPSFGWVTVGSIFIHEFIQEISEFFVLRESGFSVKKSLITNFVVSSTILIGAIGGFFALDTFEIIELPLIGIAAGSFLVVVLKDLIPHSIKNSSNLKHHLKHLVWFFIGIVIMSFVSLLGGH
jgi:zinc and cadmium transporter